MHCLLWSADLVLPTYLLWAKSCLFQNNPDKVSSQWAIFGLFHYEPDLVHFILATCTVYHYGPGLVSFTAYRVLLLTAWAPCWFNVEAELIHHTVVRSSWPAVPMSTCTCAWLSMESAKFNTAHVHAWKSYKIRTPLNNGSFIPDCEVQTLCGSWVSARVYTPGGSPYYRLSLITNIITNCMSLCTSFAAEHSAAQLDWCPSLGANPGLCLPGSGPSSSSGEAVIPGVRIYTLGWGRDRVHVAASPVAANCDWVVDGTI